MLQSIEVVGVELLPGSRHGLDGPTALVKIRWQGELPGPEFLLRLEERLAYGLRYLERIDWKYSRNENWLEFPSNIPVRPFPADFLVEPAPDPLSGLLAAGVTALQWACLVPVAAARVLRHEGHEIDLAVPYWLPQKLQAALTIVLEAAQAMVSSEASSATAGTEPSAGLEAMEQALEGTLGQDALEVDGFWMAWHAHQRGLPMARMDFGVVEIGHGRSRRRFFGSLQGGDAVASVQASNKLVIKRQLLRAGVPVPAYAVVENEEQALAVAQAMGWPVVLKPIDRSEGRGVTDNIWRPADLLRAYRQAREQTRKPLLMERHVEGDDHRLLVLDGEVIAAVGSRYVQVRGNGFQTLGQLIEQARGACSDPEEAALFAANKESRRLIDAQGLSLEDVVESGRVVQLRRRRNALPVGGSAVDELDDLHPELIQLAVRATTVLGVRLAGLDVISPDVSQPPLEAGAMVLELNPRPFLRTIRFSTRPRDIERRVFEASYPPGSGSVPVVLLDGSGTGDRLLEMLEQHLHEQGLLVGAWSSEGNARLGGEAVVWTAAEGSREAPGQLVLCDGRVEAALLNPTAQSWQKDGFPCSRCSIGVLLEGGPLREQGLLTEWLSMVQGPVVVVGDGGPLLEVVGSLVGERLLPVADEAAAVEAVLAQLGETAMPLG
jgi:D-alanine-D-alanine ligase-like ATP-grasp enzyme